MNVEFSGRAFERGGEGYEAARLATVWNGRAPERYPDLVVQAGDESDVVAAVRLARERGWKLAVRSGGHSWAANHVRDGGLLLDVSRLDSVEIDSEARTAVVGPGVRGDELLEALLPRGLFFPAGHCPGVALGGYLLQGGFGWNGRVYGPACMSVEAIDVVTADGELVRADERQNADLLWAARGAGPGFFGAVVRFHLRLHEAPGHIANGVYLYPLDALEEVFAWAREIGPRVAREMEMMVFIHRDADGEPEVAVTGPVLARSAERAAEALTLLETCPVRERAKATAPNVPVRMADLYAAAHESYPDGSRYAVDNIWTHAPADELLPGLRRAAATIPEAPSHLLWMNWGPSPTRPDMAYSVEDDVYIAAYAVWRDPVDDAANLAWAAERIGEMAPLSSGIQLADENLAVRPARFAADANMVRLDELRAKHDPDCLFHPWMGRL